MSGHESSTNLHKHYLHVIPIHSLSIQFFCHSLRAAVLLPFFTIPTCEIPPLCPLRHVSGRRRWSFIDHHIPDKDLSDHMLDIMAPSNVTDPQQTTIKTHNIVPYPDIVVRGQNFAGWDGEEGKQYGCTKAALVAFAPTAQIVAANPDVCC